MRHDSETINEVANSTNLIIRLMCHDLGIPYDPKKHGYNESFNNKTTKMSNLNLIKNGSIMNDFDFRLEMTKEQFHEKDVKCNIQLRVNLDEQLQNLKSCPKSDERNTAIIRLKEAIMWLGMDLKRLNEPNPYPHSYNPDSEEISPTADGLVL